MNCSSGCNVESASEGGQASRRPTVTQEREEGGLRGGSGRGVQKGTGGTGIQDGVRLDVAAEGGDTKTFWVFNSVNW